MKFRSTDRTDMPMNDKISVSRLNLLLRLITETADQTAEIAERRHALIAGLAPLVSASAGFWGWGRGNPVDSTITPIAALSFGMRPDVWQKAVRLSLGPDSVRLFSIPIRQRMQDRMQVTVTRSMLHTDDAWKAETEFRRELNATGMDNLLVSVNYYSNDCWFHTTLGRAPGEPDFTTEDAALLDLTMSAVSWMQPRISESVPVETFVGLTSRQRTVMLQLLDGRSRKQIAKSLSITVHTANDHIKAIYQHFQVCSATQLAARFLQSH
jgi:DNA-binding CsgD family transcriptional regulator